MTGQPRGTAEHATYSTRNASRGLEPAASATVRMCSSSAAWSSRPPPATPAIAASMIATAVAWSTFFGGNSTLGSMTTSPSNGAQSFVASASVIIRSRSIGISDRRDVLARPDERELERLDERVGVHHPDVHAVEVVEALGVEDRRCRVDAVERESLAELRGREDLLAVAG